MTLKGHTAVRERPGVLVLLPSAHSPPPPPPSCSAALEEALSLSTTSSPGPHQETLLLIGFVGVFQVLEKIEFCEQNAVKENVLGKNAECCYSSKILTIIWLF